MVIMFILEMQQENQKGLHTAISYPKTWCLKGREQKRKPRIYGTEDISVVS